MPSHFRPVFSEQASGFVGADQKKLPATLYTVTGKAALRQTRSGFRSIRKPAKYQRNN
jgi:hypothetical protein